MKVHSLVVPMSSSGHSSCFDLEWSAVTSRKIRGGYSAEASGHGEALQSATSTSHLQI